MRVIRAGRSWSRFEAEQRCLFLLRRHQALLLALPIFFFLHFAFVVFSFAFGECDFTFDKMALPVHCGANAGVTFLLHGGENIRQLTIFQQQFTCAGGIGDEMRGDTLQW